MNTTTPSPAVLVPGLWLGGWAWDDVVEHLARRGVAAVAVTLPGLDPAARRDSVTLADHVGAVVDAVGEAGAPAVLVAHSGAGMLASAVLDRVPQMVRHVVYVDSGPVADGAVARPDLGPQTTEVPLPSWAELEANGASLAGLDEHVLTRFAERAVPHPAGPLREPVTLRNPARNHVPARAVCCSLPSVAVRELAAVPGMFAPLGDLAAIEYVDLPTGHWPMWSEPDALADTIAAAVAA